MLNIYYGDMQESVYNTAAYFKYDYEDSWIIDPFVKEMIQDVDQSTVLDSGVIDSPVLGKIPPTGLSGGVKTLILVKFDKDKIFNASTCGDNCAKWLLKIAESEDRTINLRHLMNFGKDPFVIRILNTGEIVHSMEELVSICLMKGKHRIIVSTKRLKYDFEIRRNLTVIRGDSATGKTTLVDMIREYVNNPSGTPVELTCDKKCYVLEGSLWKEQLSAMQDSIVFIDEGNEFIKTVEFADTIQKTDNYYVIVSRESLPSLPYSVEEIYGIRTSGKYGTLKPCYHEFYRIYGAQTLKKDIKPEVVITEDSNSGYQFFNSVCRQQQLKCETMNGKSNVFHYLNMHKNERILVIADGAAFGSEIDRVMQLMGGKDQVVLYLPESFEWLILKAKVVKSKWADQVLEKPWEYVESKTYFSWERFFTAVLIEETNGSYLAYAKRKLNPAYLNDSVKDSILEQMTKIKLF